MAGDSYEISRTLRCKNLNVPGTLSKLTSAIAKVGGNIGNITTVHLGHHYTVRDIEVFVSNKELLSDLLNEISKLKEVTILEVRDNILDFHEGGKVRMVNSVSIKSLDDLRKVYTPGVAEVCNLIKENLAWKDKYTSIPYSIALVTDGTAVLGLGDIGPLAGMPVMEGKAALIYHLTGVSMVPILLDTTDPDAIVDTVKHIAITFSGIHLEDIASPRCFVIQEKLEQVLDIPIMHDDQQGTGVVVLAALINACRITGISLEKAKVGLIGLGAAGMCIGRFLLQYTGNPPLGTARTEATIKRYAEQGGIPSTLKEIMEKADIVVATSTVPGLIEPNMVRKRQIIFALSNPVPELEPQLALAAGAALAADGKTINNLLAYPGIWRGALDAKARRINFEMYKAAAIAIASSANEGELVPSPLEPKVHLAVTHGVAKAAVETGVAQRELDNDYFENTNIKEPPWS